MLLPQPIGGNWDEVPGLKEMSPPLVTVFDRGNQEQPIGSSHEVWEL
jgi:hypothetical protein